MILCRARSIQFVKMSFGSVVPYLVVSHDSIRGCVRLLVRPLVMLLSAGRDKPANDLFRVYKLVCLLSVHKQTLQQDKFRML